MRLAFRSFTANLWARGFMRNFHRVAGPLVSDRWQLETAVRRHAQKLFDDELAALVDKKARLILAMCTLVLAAFEQLKDRLAEPAIAYDAVRRAFAGTYPGPMAWLFRSWLWLHRDPVADLQGRSFVKQGRRMYGKSMQFAEEKSVESADMLITRCAYHEFFVRHGAPQLTLLVCAWDRVWMDLVDRSSRPVRTERPTTISTGGECCRFRFVRDEAKAGKGPNDIVLVQLQSRSSN